MAGSYYNSILRINNQTGTSYTLSIADFNSDTITIMDNASANTVTVPPSVFPIGAQLLVAQEGLGQTSFVAGAGVTINAIGLSISSRYKSVALIQVALNEWDAFGTLDTASYTARTTAFATATGIVDTTILNALNTFDLGLISNGLDTKMKAVYPFVGSTATTQKYNFMDARDLDVAFRLQFFGGGTFSNNGYLPNGTNAFADTFLNISTQTSLFNIHYSIYCRNNTSQGIDIGVANSNSGYKDEGWMASRYNGFAQGGFYDNDAGISGGGIKVSNSDSTGMYISSAIAMNNQFLRKNNTTLGTWTGLDVTSLPANTTAYIGAVHRENDNLAIEFSNKQYAIATIGSGLNITEASTFYNLVQAMQTSLSRQV